TLSHTLESALPAKLQSVRRNGDAFGNSKLIEQFKVCARTAPYIENRWFGRFSPWEQPRKETGDDVPASYKPPMPALDLIHDRVGMFFHFLWKWLIGQVCGVSHV